MKAIQDNDESQIEEAILRLSRSRRVFAPLGLAVGAPELKELQLVG